MLNITKNTRVYIICMPNFATGGTELLHQIGFELLKRGIDVKMYYIFSEKMKGSPVPERFAKYKVPFVDNILDQEDNVIIIPEIYTNYYNSFSNIQKIIWWMSVDNYYKSLKDQKQKYYKNKLKSLVNMVFNKKVLNAEKYLGKKYLMGQNKLTSINLVQSKYAYEFLSEKGFENIFYLSDYINDDYFEELDDFEIIGRNNVVVYNPAKGKKFTEELIRQGKDISFVPIQDMTVEEVKKLLQTSKVYIDFGNHPGKDRMPREAALCGCCIITGLDGAAQYFEDIPIDQIYKYKATQENIPVILDLIRECFANYQERLHDFDSYRLDITGQKNKFQKEIDYLFNSTNK
ncbi:hypothetical protein [Trichococcus shcherbakoviae]|uniref:Glycosyl transferases group 1 n=1 Tax=Trichococcus shcherbakoviae subsp. psychrophilus TaxID=2585775 RepID=A0A5C5E5G4_9LACT|nr:hypothetical protein [Trichococcus shcherbakoviae]TNV68458.1 hypothetical protein FHK04_09605 [Trichococcus shcherbakoviae subsp. psychrophilus]